MMRLRENHINDIDQGDILLAHLETLIEAVQAAFERAKARHSVTILDTAPARKVLQALLAATDCITPNQIEAAILVEECDQTITTFQDAACAAERVVALGPRSAILKIGDSGCLFSEGVQRIAVKAFRVNAVDTTAAGDVFNGAFSVSLSEGMPLSDALLFANAAAAVPVTRRGAQPSIPLRTEVDAMSRAPTAKHSESTE